MDPDTLEAVNAALAVLTVAGSSEQLARWADYFWSRNNRAMQEASEQAARDWIHEALRAQQAGLKRLQQRVGSFEQAQAELDARMARHDVWKIQQNYLFESLREPTEERRKMLAHATAAVVNLALSEAECARVERLLRELDPDDVRTLRGLWMVAGGVVFEDKHFGDAGELRFELWKRSDSADVLLSSGCVRVAGQVQAGPFVGGKNNAVVTKMGRLVLQSMRTYLADRPPQFEVPGREVLEGSRTSDAAWAMIDECGDLRDLALQASHGRSVWYGFPQWSQKDLTPPKATAKSSLRFFGVPDDLTARFREVPSEDRVVGLDGGASCEKLAVQVHRSDAGGWEATVFGPHDVLRHLADAIDALWI